MSLSIVEYLYIDQQRLDSYFEQVCASPMVHDRVPTWKATVGLGFGVEGSQSLVSRPYTAHEKILKLMEAMKDEPFFVSFSGKSEILAKPRSLELNDLGLQLAKRPFHLIDCSALRVQFPPESDHTLRPYVSMWLTVPQDNLFNLYMFEDTRRSDEPIEYRLMSGYTRWNMVMSTIRSEPELFAGVGIASENGPFERARSDELDYLRSNGAIISDKRNIQALYRVRRFVNSACGVHVYGYPVFLSEGPSRN